MRCTCSSCGRLLPLYALHMVCRLDLCAALTPVYCYAVDIRHVVAFQIAKLQALGRNDAATAPQVCNLS